MCHANRTKIADRSDKCCQEIIFDYLLLSARCLPRRESKRKHWTNRYERHGVALAQEGRLKSKTMAGFLGDDPAGKKCCDWSPCEKVGIVDIFPNQHRSNNRRSLASASWTLRAPPLLRRPSATRSKRSALAHRTLLRNSSSVTRMSLMICRKSGRRDVPA